MVSKSWGSRLFDVLNYSVLLLLVVAIIYPLYYMFIVSISDGLHVIRGDVKFWPINVNLETYRVILSDSSITTAYMNTLLYTSTGTLLNVAMTALCAFPLARRKLYGRSVITVFILFTMFFSGGIIPNYILIKGLGLLDTMWAIVLPPAINVWYMIIMRTFFQSIPEEIYESSTMDGANDMITFFRITLPLSVPVIATMVMFYAVWHWNSFFPSLLYLSSKSMYPVQLMMRNVVIDGDLSAHQGSIGGSELELLVSANNVKYAVIWITILPILLVYPFVQKYFVKGVMVGSLKG